MNKEQFQREYLGEWIINKKYEKAYELWLHYFYYSELYDRSVCSGVDEHGMAMPITPEERKLITTNAINLDKYIRMLKRQWELENNTMISQKDWNAPKRHLERLTFKGLEEEFHRVFSS